MSVKRYRYDFQSGIVADDKGGLVSYADYEKLATENAGLNKYITQSCYVFDGEQHEISDAYICATDGGIPETPSTDAFLAEVRAHGVEMFAAVLRRKGDDAFFDAIAEAQANAADQFAAQLRKRGE
ncbi:hypothetical protein [Citrobacter sedlakii]|uniref:hypothetical protein n=1 Tax=Citrobacter sedlakii TaxID=67826 RepID=UPI003DA111FB